MDKIKRLDAKDQDFPNLLEKALHRDHESDDKIFDAVASIIKDVKIRRDSAVLEYTKKFDLYDVKSVTALEITGFDTALSKIDKSLLNSLEISSRRIFAYHERQVAQSWEFSDDIGVSLGQRITPLQSVGIYVPGGTASYPSSVLMNAIPAKVAGVSNITMVVPSQKGIVSEAVLAAAALSGVSRIFSIGGAQAIAALAYGTESIPRVDKIVGPGNVYVASAKKQVFGDVGIDMVAGPSEILIVCDGLTPPEWIATDLCSQAEHDPNAQSIFISPDANQLDKVEEELNRIYKQLPRWKIIKSSLEKNGVFIKVDSVDEIAKIVDVIAPEHLELSVAKPRELMSEIKNAGAVFLGRFCPEVFGDYCAGSNHVLPTSGAARFASPLGVYDFQKRTSFVECNELGASELGRISLQIANSEGLAAHAQSAKLRIK